MRRSEQELLVSAWQAFCHGLFAVGGIHAGVLPAGGGWPAVPGRGKRRAADGTMLAPRRAYRFAAPHRRGLAPVIQVGVGARQPHRQVVDRVSRRVICRCPRRCHRGHSPAARQRRDSPDHPPGTCSRAPSRRPQNWALLMPAGCCCATPTSPASGFTLRTRPARRASESG